MVVQWTALDQELVDEVADACPLLEIVNGIDCESIGAHTAL